MNFTRNTFKTTEMHWQQRQHTTVRFEIKRVENDTTFPGQEKLAA